MKPSEVRFALVVAAFAFGVLAQALVSDGNFRWAVTPYVVAVAALTIAVANRPLSSFAPRCREVSGDSKPARLTRLRIGELDLERRLGLGGVALSLLTLLASLRAFAAGPPNTMGWWFYGLSITLLLLVMPTIEGRWTTLARRLGTRTPFTLEFQSVVQISALCAILLLALVVRVYGLRELPFGLWYDEAANLVEAALIQRDPGSAPVFATTLPTLYLFPVAALTGLLGSTAETIRLVSAAFSLAGIVVVFLLARLLMGPFAGLAAAFVMAVMRWDINFSRIGMHGITMSLTTALAAYLTLRALRGGRLSDFGYAGAALGFGMWFYASFRLFPLLLGLMLLHHLLFQRPRIKPFLLRVALMALVALAVAAPVAQFAAREPDIFFDRTASVSVFWLVPAGEVMERIGESLGKHALMFNYEGDANPRHNLPNAPMLDFLSGALLALGLALCLVRWRSVALIILPCWILIMILPGALTLPWEAPQALRAIGVIPAVALVIALALGVIWQTGRESSWPPARRGTPFVVAGILAAIALLNINTYFGDQANDPRVYAAFTTDEMLVGRHMREQQGRGYTLFTSRQFKHSIGIGLVAHNPRYEVVRAPPDIPLDAARAGRGAAIYLEPREASVFRLLRAYYPDARFEEARPPSGGEVMFYSAVISREQLEGAQGLKATYTLANGDTRTATKRTTEASWLLESAPGDAPFDLVWEGALHVTEQGEYLLALDEGTDAEVWLDDRRVLSNERRSLSIRPAVGVHALEVRGRVEERAGALRVLWQPPGGPLEPISVSNLFRHPVRPLGLAGRFYQSGTEEPPFDAARVTPAMDSFWYDPVVPEPYLAVWEGALDAPAAGEYTFRLSAFGTLTLYIDGDRVARHPPDESAPAEAQWYLDAGERGIRVEYTSVSPPSQFGIYWARPSGALEPLPIERLSPTPERMFTVADVQ